MKVTMSVFLVFFSISMANAKGNKSTQPEASDSGRAQLVLKCISGLSQKFDRKGSRYHAPDANVHYYFYTGGTDIDGSPAGPGFIQLRSSGARFCNANLPREGNIKFNIDGQDVTYSASASRVQNNLGKIDSSKCKPESNEMLTRMAKHIPSFVEAYVKANPDKKVDEVQKDIKEDCGEQRAVIAQAIKNVKSETPASPSAGVPSNNAERE